MVSYGLEGELLNEHSSFLRLGKRIPRIFLAFPAQTGHQAVAAGILPEFTSLRTNSSRIIGVSWARSANPRGL